MFKTSLVLFICVIPALSQDLTRYQYQRSIIITDRGQQYSRRSSIVFSDNLEPREVSVTESGKRPKVDWGKFYDPQIKTLDGKAVNPRLPVNGSLWKDGSYRYVRRSSNEELSLPMETEFDDGRLKFSIRYSDYKLFRTSVEIREIDEPVAQWPTNTNVSVYFMPGFSPEQQASAIKGIESWQGVGGLTITVAGNTDTPQTCAGCVTFRRASLAKEAGQLWAWRVNPPWVDYAWIDVDARITKAEAVEATVAHEWGHALSLADCRNCDSIMAPFPGWNKWKLLSPTQADIQLARLNYGGVR